MQRIRHDLLAHLHHALDLSHHLRRRRRRLVDRRTGPDLCVVVYHRHDAWDSALGPIRVHLSASRIDPLVRERGSLGWKNKSLLHSRAWRNGGEEIWSVFFHLDLGSCLGRLHGLHGLCDHLGRTLNPIKVSQDIGAMLDS